MIKTIKWHDYKVLKDLELDFNNHQNNKIFNTIILAGENGTGKSTILNSLATFLNAGTFEPFAEIIYNTDENSYKLYKNEDNPVIHMRQDLNNGGASSKNNNMDRISNDKEDIRYYGVQYSRAKSGFNTAPVRTIMTSQLDDSKYFNDDSDDYTNIKQLIVDIDSQDDKLCHKELMTRKTLKDEEFEPICKMIRFKRAFNNFFENIKFIGIDDENRDEKRIIFEKHGDIISIDELSTGEKQIVFRGAQMLRNMNNIQGGLILIDEPELSMHPKWQEKILKFYKDLFTDVNGNQNVQMIITTHSDYVIKSALEDTNNNLIIILNDNNGTIEPNYIASPCILPIITSAEVNYLAFGICSIDYHAQLYGYLQNKIAHKESTAECSVKHCDDYIAQSQLYNNNYAFQSHYTSPITHHTTTYNTLPTYIRNKIDHPDFKTSFSKSQLESSIEFLRQLCQLP
ncbi:AAA family ATPase [bacterium]|nr:AAA family ATPase [bacterium]